MEEVTEVVTEEEVTEEVTEVVTEAITEAPVTEELLNEETTLYSEFTSVTVSGSEYSVDQMYSEIVVNTRQSAECLTSILALFSVLIIYLVGRFIASIFSKIFS